MPQAPENASISKLLQGDKCYHIPHYQREFSWDIANCEQLYNDVINAEPDEYKKEYFIGTCILKKYLQSDYSEEYEVIDGQQRLVTISLLLAAIHNNLQEMLERYESNFNADAISDLKSERKNIRKLLLIYSEDKKSLDKFKLKIPDHGENQKIYAQILKNFGIAKNADGSDISYFKSKKMVKVANYFDKSISEDLKNTRNELDKVEFITKTVERIQTIYFVKICVDEKENPYQLFETFNNRGKALSVIDVVKNIMFKECKGEDEVQKSYKDWDTITRNITRNSKQDTYNADTDRYLRHFYNAFHVDNENRLPSKASYATRSNLIKIYSEIVKKRSAIETVNFLKSKSGIYNWIINPKYLKIKTNTGETLKVSEACREKIVQDLQFLNRAEGKPINALLLYLFSKFMQKPRAFDNEEKALQEIVNFLTKFFIRRNISKFPRTNTMDPLVEKMIKSCQISLDNHSSKIQLSVLENDFIEASENKEFDEFKTDIKELTTERPASKKLISIILEQINNYKASKINKAVDSTWEIEHILPQGSNIPKGWVKMLEEGNEDLEKKDKRTAKQIQDELGHCWGNLTLTQSRGNKELSNSELNEKQNRSTYGYRHTNIWLDNFTFEVKHLKHPYYLGNVPSWDARSIQARMDTLVDYLANFYRFSNESDKKDDESKNKKTSEQIKS